MLRIEYSRRAESDGDQIMDYYADKSEGYARKLAGRIDRKIALLASHPKMGRVRSDLSPGLRSVVVHPYVIVYSATTEVLQVVRILHGARDIAAEFHEEENEE